FTPILLHHYGLNYMDLVNVSYAALDMTGDLGFSNAVFGFGAGVFFVGYFLLQVPGTVLLEVWSARRFMGVSLIVWGTLATFTGLLTNAPQFYWIRFLLGAAEAGFVPGASLCLPAGSASEGAGRA